MRYAIFLMVFLFSVAPAFAAFNGPSDARRLETTASASLNADEGTTCVLEGNIVKHMEKNRYLFKDDSGEITVDIPPHVFGNIDVTPETKVRVTGEIRGKKRPEKADAHMAVRYLEKL